MKEIKIYDIVGKNAISMSAGDKLYAAIAKDLTSEQGEKLNLNFEGVELFASPFFNSSIGLIIKDVNIDDLMKKMEVNNISDIGKQLLNLVISNAIKFYDDSSNTAEDAIKKAQKLMDE